MHDISQMLFIFFIIILLFISFVLLYLRVHHQSYHQYITENKLREKQFQTELLQTQLEIQEKTLKNISQEIHDNIGQALTMAKLNLNTLPVQEELKEKVVTTKDIISKVISDLRDLSKSLNTDYISRMGLQSAIDAELRLIEKTTTIQTSIDSNGELPAIDKQKELILFRMIQEILNNALKHSGAEKISVLFDCRKNLEIVIADDGKGFDTESIPGNRSTGLGLRNLENRAELIGGRISIESFLSAGTRVKIILPVSPGNYEDYAGQ